MRPWQAPQAQASLPVLSAGGATTTTGGAADTETTSTITWTRWDYYYDTSWRVAEERKAVGETTEFVPAKGGDADATATGASTTSDSIPAAPGALYAQYVWDIRYIDAPILRDRFTEGETTRDGDALEGPASSGPSSDPSGSLPVNESTSEPVNQQTVLSERLYYLNDANFNTTALFDGLTTSATYGEIVERYMYTPYGETTVLNPDWSADAGNASDFANEIQYAGYRFDPESGLYHVRNRPYDAPLGRFIARDPAESGMNLYEYCASGPVDAVDPMGLEEVERPSFRAPCERNWAEAAWDRVKNGIGAWFDDLWHNDPAAGAPSPYAPIDKGRNESNYTIGKAVLHRILKPAGRGVEKVAEGMDAAATRVVKTLRDPVCFHYEVAVPTGNAMEYWLKGVVSSERREEIWFKIVVAKEQWAALSATKQGDHLVENASKAFFVILSGKAAAEVTQMARAATPMESIPFSALRSAGAYASGEAQGIVHLSRPGRVMFNGMEVRAVRDLAHVDEATLHAMAQRGFAAKDIRGRPLVLHHMGQKPAGPVVEIPRQFHNINNPIQHPLGNMPGVGLTAEQRAAFDVWRVEYWKARAVDQLSKRSIGHE